MTGRVLLNGSGLKVSKPGIDVLTASPGGLQFSSDWSAFGQFTSGSYGVGWSVLSGEKGRHDGSISFGKTFPTKPAVWFYLQSSGGLVPIGNASGFSLFGSDGTGSPPRTFGVIAQVGVSGIAVTAYYDKKTSGWPAPSVAFQYRVFEYNL